MYCKIVKAWTDCHPECCIDPGEECAGKCAEEDEEDDDED